jgi:uncharacterized protein (TIGR03437 family)
MRRSYVRLLSSFCVLLAAAISLRAQTAQVTAAVTARQPIPNNFCIMPPTETQFLTTDSAAWVVFTYSGGQAGDNAYVDWFDPTGALYRTYNFTQTSSGGNYCYAYYISVYGYYPASSPGTWRVRLRWNDTEVFSRNFTISTPASSPLTLITDTTFPKATLGAPYSLSLQASGGTPPYKWSLTGTPPAGMTFSNGGTLTGTPSATGSYQFVLHLADSASPANTLDRDVTLGVALPALNIGVGSLAFSFTEGGAAPDHQSVSLTSNGLALNYSASVNSKWLVVAPRSGGTPATLDVSVNTDGLSPGSYQDTITILSSSSSTYFQTIAVNLAIVPAGAGPAGGIIKTVAGNDWTFTIPGGLGTKAPLGFVDGLTTDGAGNVYVADHDNDVIVRWQPDGTASVVAGNGISGFSGDGGSALNASLSVPSDVAFDRFGNMYIADSNNDRIRKVSPDGTISTFAGVGRYGFGGDGGPAITAILAYPTALAVDAAGNVFLYDSGNYRIRKIGTDGTINTVAGNGKSGYSGEGAALQVATEVAGQMAIDSKGNLYFGDFNGPYYRKVTPAGQTSIIAGTGTAGFSGDGGLALRAAVKDPNGVAVDSQDNIYTAELNNDRIRKITTDGIINTIAGAGGLGTTGDGGPALKAQMNPIGVTVDRSGNVILADFNSKGIRRIDSTGTINTIMGNDGYRGVPNGTAALNAFFLYPRGLVFDGKGGLIVTDTDANRLRRVAPDGTISVFAGTGTSGCCADGGPATGALLVGPRSPAIDAAGNIYFADSGNHQVRKITTDGKISTVAGTGGFATPGAYDGDGGPATKAHLNYFEAVAIDRNGVLYIADTNNHVIRKVAADGTISTVAGTGGQYGYAGDGGPATAARLYSPRGIAFDASNNMYIADAFNEVIRMVSPGGVISTFAGNNKYGFSGDGGAATRASMQTPWSLAFDSAGNLYILEENGHRIRKVTPGGIISTVAGTGLQGFSGDGGPSLAAALRYPQGSMAVDANGTLYFTDTDNHRVRSISLGQVAAPTMSATPASLAFTAVSGGSTTTAVPVSVSASSFGLPFQITTSTTSGGNWLLADVASGTSPATVNVSANPAGLAAGTYQGTVRVSSSYASPSTIPIAVTFTVKAASSGKLLVDSNALAFSAIEGAGPASTQLSIRNGGSGSIGFVVGSSTANGGSWLTISASTGTVASTSPVALTVTATPGSLTAGIYSGLITVSSPDTTDPAISIPVTLVMSKPVPVIVLSQTGLTFAKVQGGGNPLPQSIAILNSGQGTMNWTATATTLTGGNWLSLSPASGTVVRPFLDYSTVNVQVSAAGLASGNYFGQIQVRATGANNSPQTVSVVLNVLGPNSTLGPEVRPSGLVFIGTADSSPGSQAVQIANRGSGNTAFKTTSLNFANVVWFSNVPAVGSVPASQPAQITVQPDLSKRSPGIDRGVITLLFDDGSVQTVNILSVVPPPGTVLAAEGLRSGEPLAGGCSPSKLAIQVTNPSLSSPRGQINQPLSLEAQVADDCGNPVKDSNGAVKVTFSTGEAALTMQHINNGKWAKTWQPKSSSPTTMVATFTVFASSGSKILQDQKDVTISLDSGAPVPVVTPGGVLNAASFASTPLVAPGGLITIFGDLLADGATLPNTTPVPTSLSGAQVRLGDQLLPLFFSSTKQINAQVPFGLPVNTRLQLVVTHGNTISVPSDLSVAAAQPAVFAINQQGTGQGAIVNGVTNVLADSGHPLHAGDVATIYCTGLGTVSPAVPEGVAASKTVLSRTVNSVTVTIGGKTAAVAFAGLAPGFVGLYQVNAAVPAGLTAGDSVPVVLSTSGQTSPAVTISVR